YEEAERRRKGKMVVSDFQSRFAFPSEKVLLEGSPGVGKTSLVLALGKFSGHSVVYVDELIEEDHLFISASGKTSVIRLRSQLTGNVLNELNLSFATNIFELLGCFEQYNAIRHYRLAVYQVKRYMNAYISRQIESPTYTFTKQSSLISRWASFSSSIDNSSTSFAVPSAGKSSRGICRSLELLVEIIEDLQLDIENGSEDLD
ncbi:midasin isoform X1, partial [Tanacetum coccineum]